MTDAAAIAEGRLPSTHRWVVGGHSLGGVAAAAEAGRGSPALAGLLLHAAHPVGSIASATVPVLSVYGTQDGVSTPERVRASASDLPVAAKLVPIDGAIHSSFGDYGDQRGDGIPSVTRGDAQREITAATLAWLATLR